MQRLARIIVSSKRFVRVSAIVLLGGLTAGLAGCDEFSPRGSSEATDNDAKCGGGSGSGPKFDPAGAKNVGNQRGQQFIGGQCRNAKDCGSGCCAFPCGICSGPGAQFQAGKQGCGFGDRNKPPANPEAARATADAAPAPEKGGQGNNNNNCVGGPKFDPAGDKNVGNQKGQQFIGGQCVNAKDCASGCCALPCGICSGPGAQFQAGKQGCGFEAKNRR